jgi:hypothetical protein
MIEGSGTGSGSVSLTNGFGCGYGRPKNIRLVLKPEIKMHLEQGEGADSRRRGGQPAGSGGRRPHPRATGDSRPGKQPALKFMKR